MDQEAYREAKQALLMAKELELEGASDVEHVDTYLTTQKGRELIQAMFNQGYREMHQDENANRVHDTSSAF